MSGDFVDQQTGERRVDRRAPDDTARRQGTRGDFA